MFGIISFMAHILIIKMAKLNEKKNTTKRSPCYLIEL